ncbi:hypothetical protein [Riemerella anatipestifer]|nr:hypothetical protein [Riemerella anatipestifer]MCQ4040391.1 hypothetical protein [Riemerella anatipestifer]MCT6761995.1 hypothetical protein [Riemerella anatipestifer]MCT6766031.1 hypothetical protein [Riemerella anatipestifer]MCT6770210.1 hypothetical protein [Riemerella anatipestifer]MCT6774319.1 hypothetical protein [Riemerella anatipestifer]
MTDNEKHKIATSFPDKYETNKLDLEISTNEFKIFEDGIFAGSMEEKWNVFVVSDILYFARSWTNFCIYKVFVKRQVETVILSDFQVSRDYNQYKSRDIDYDTVLLKKLLQMFLQREDFYSDPKLELPLIKRTIERLDPKNEFKKSIGSNNVGLTRQIHNALTTEEQEQYFEIIGWTELKKMIADKSDSEPLISLYMLNRQNKSATTYYFDKEANELLGQITINKR